MSRLQADFGDRVRILAVGYTEDAPARIGMFMQVVKPTYPVGIISRADALKFLNVSDGPQAMPRLLLLDKTGKPAASWSWNDPPLRDIAMFPAPVRQALEKLTK